MVFLSVALALYWTVHRVRWARLTLLFIASVVFYSAWQPLPLLLFAGLAAIMRGAAFFLHREKSKWVVGLAVASFLIILGVFKYADLFYSTAVDLAQLAGLGWHYSRLNWMFPLGISFGVFQAIHYVVDVYRGHITQKYGYWKTLLYLLFFPHLIAGPIVRAPYLLARFDDTCLATDENWF